ncbi:hypothetical protein PR202_gb00583 [Eleusine coracana subsp. coracana]|uniref:Uncharacterized protein n=1 Tax=Eleusine coracana subsp. coracana TaxID=191504 RepID=A0AAV5DTR1_ELECO|nr:hypothetical protein PR202_gb00583 [Eleusine coracana subsp. coracana]
MCDQPEAAFRDAMLTGSIFPGWPTALYLKAVALSELNMQSDAMNMFNEGVKQEEEAKRQRESWRS